MKNTSKTASKKLWLHKSTLRQLTSKELDQAAGGRMPETDSCEYFCASRPYCMP